MKKAKWLLIPAFALMGALALTGCDGDDDDNGSSSSGTATNQTSSGGGTPVTLESGSKAHTSGRIGSKIVPSDGTVTCTATWADPTVSAVLILDIGNGPEVARATVSGGGTISGPIPNGANAAFTIDFQGGAANVITAYSISFVAD